MYLYCVSFCLPSQTKPLTVFTAVIIWVFAIMLGMPSFIVSDIQSYNISTPNGNITIEVCSPFRSKIYAKWVSPLSKYQSVKYIYFVHIYSLHLLLFSFKWVSKQSSLPGFSISSSLSFSLCIEKAKSSQLEAIQTADSSCLFVNTWKFSSESRQTATATTAQPYIKFNL